MIEIKCDRCGKNCGLNAFVLDVRVIHNPNPTSFVDIGEIRLTDDDTRIRYMLCQDCYDGQGLPNPYRTGEKLAAEIRNSGFFHADVQPVRHSAWKSEGDCGVTKCPICGWSIEECIDWRYCPDCGARMDGEDGDGNG